jgi:hypothetical protein
MREERWFSSKVTGRRDYLTSACVGWNKTEETLPDGTGGGGSMVNGCSWRNLNGVTAH